MLLFCLSYTILFLCAKYGSKIDIEEVIAANESIKKNIVIKIGPSIIPKLAKATGKAINVNPGPASGLIPTEKRTGNWAIENRESAKPLCGADQPD